MSDKTIARRMAEFALELQYDDLPSEVIEEVKRFLYDSVGCALGGFNTHDVKAMLEIYSDMGGKPEATLFGSGEKLPAANATLLNSLMIRALDFNDIYWKEDPSHPSDLIPAALAMAERQNSSAKELIVAIVLAYEFEQRLCLFAKPGVRERKWHHATLTQFVSPIVAGRLLGLDAEQMENAIGISGGHNFTPGAAAAGQLSMMKNTVDPMAVQSGVIAALMAEKGFTGTRAIFEGKEGLMDILGDDWDEEALLGGLGESFKILECSMKAFPTEALTHSHITCALKIVRDHDVLPDDIKEIKVTTIARAVDILFDPEKYNPKSRETADHSLPYVIAAAVVDRKITTDQFSDERIADPKIRSVLPKIVGEASEEFEKMFPAKQPSKVVITLNDGTAYTEKVDYPKGDPREPMSQDDLDDKFKGLTSLILDDESRRKIKDTIWNLESLNNVSDLMNDLKIMEL
ncbi:MAG: MmgE/PrpD family protein [Candidatus Marinimicrobia bacterium]|nr:MmgE/PrpD family protein [Candidatus Neomarinimicrobiota bacterium]